MPQSTPIRILVVDDERFSLAVIEASLSSIDDCVVETCRTGEDALELAPAFKPDLLILDVKMPGMDGPETLAGLRRLPETEETPVIFMTATTPVHNAADYHALGANAVIAKPIRRDTLIATIDEVSLQYGVTPPPRPGREIEFVMPDELANEYARAIPEQMERIIAVWDAYRNGTVDDLSPVADAAHNIAGTAQSYGYAEIGNVATLLEKELFAASGGEERIASLILDLEKASTKLRAPNTGDKDQ